MMQAIKRKIYDKALELGFTDMKVARAQRLNDNAERLQEWLNRGYHGEMDYMENHFDKRVDPTELVPGSKTVISLAYNYYPAVEQKKDTYKIARYAYGKDYHHILKKKLYELYNYINDELCEIDGRVFTDSAPVMERDWAERSGLGWKGKNTLLIHPKRGSYFFLAELITDLDLPIDEPIKDYCGTCRKCIDACPTDAIDENGYLLDGSKCISYATIEYKVDKLPAGLQGENTKHSGENLENWIFGCDICQEVCPWNRFSEPHDEEAFIPHPDLLDNEKEDWMNLEKDQFNEIFRKSAVKRTKYEGLMRNIGWNSKN